MPFVRLLRGDPRVPPEALSELEALDPDERVPVATVHEWLAAAIAITGDLDIGLKAAREIAAGDYGAVEYAARSAATWGEASVAVGRYMRLINDALRFSVDVEGERARIQLDSIVPLPRSSSDFQSAAFHISGQNFWSAAFPPQFEVHFTHSRPDDTREYERTFVGATLRFDAAFNGFDVPRSYLDLPVASADPKLHALIRQHAEAMLAELPRAQPLTARVRDLLADQLAAGTPTLRAISRCVSMSERTLARHLEDEGTTFKALLEDLRRRLALRYVGNSDMQLAEIALLLGFSQAAAFHRAFRRWTGQTPLEYRRAAHTPGRAQNA
jgi:AraC-like DNA-binding protein